MIASPLAAQADKHQHETAGQTDKTESKEAAKSGPQPDIEFEEPVYNFGTVQKGEKVTHVFKFKNQGQGLLKIKKVKSTCGCTVPKDYTKEIPAGGEGQIKVTFNSKNFFGAVTKTIRVSSNDPDEAVVNISLKGTIVADVVVSPPGLLGFGLIRKGQAATRNITVTQSGSQELKILKVETDQPFIKTKIIPKPVNNRRNYTVEVTVSPDAPEGIFQGKIKIYTNLEKYEKIERTVRGIVRAKTTAPKPRKSSTPSS
jgi:hypothetical protein